MPIVDIRSNDSHTFPVCNVLLQSKLEAISAIIPEGSDIAMVDEPVHRNIGDHLIHAGIERFFQQHGCTIVTRANTYSYSRRWFARHLNDDTLIVCHGGGHLGDLYPAHQRLREQLLRDFPQHRIVVLPQSIHFQCQAARDRAAEAFQAHSDFHLFVRDRQSLEKARAMQLPNVYLAPDMVHALYPLAISHNVPVMGGRTLCLLRRDKEQVPIDKATLRCDIECDWSALVKMWDTWALGGVAIAYWMLRSVGPPQWLHRMLDKRRSVLLKRAYELYGNSQNITTTRLHGMLLGVLCEKRVLLLPSSTGKTSAYVDTWLASPDCEALLSNRNEK